MERCTIIVTARDRFSTTAKCLETLMANTPEPYDLIVVMGGVPTHLARAWKQQFGERIAWIFSPDFMSAGQCLNIGLRRATTRLAVVMDNDVYVHPGWLSALLRCRTDTGAVMVVPTILEAPKTIHVAGNDLYVTWDQGRAFAYKYLRYHLLMFGERCVLTREPVDYGEMHCLLVEVEPVLRLQAFDEQMVEGSDIHCGLTMRKAGLAMYFEPTSVVEFLLRGPLVADDLRLLMWRWDMRRVLDGFRHFEQTWGMDITEHGEFKEWLLKHHNQFGLLPRLAPCRLTLAIDRLVGQMRRVLLRVVRAPKALLRRFKARQLGYYDWPVFE